MPKSRSRLSSVGTWPPAIARPHDSPRIARHLGAVPGHDVALGRPPVLDELADDLAAALEAVASRPRTASSAELSPRRSVGPPSVRRASSCTASSAWPRRSSYKFWRWRSRRPRSRWAAASSVSRSKTSSARACSAGSRRCRSRCVDEVAVVVLALLPAGGDGRHRRARRRVRGRCPPSEPRRAASASAAAGRAASRRLGASSGAHLHGLADVVEHPAQVVVVRVLHPHPRVRHVAGLDRLGRRARPAGGGRR